MCGIAGFIDASLGTPLEQLRATGTAMALSIFHRGPDDAGLWADESSGTKVKMHPCGGLRIAIRT